MKGIYSRHLIRLLTSSVFIAGLFCCITSCDKDDDGEAPTNGELKINIDADYLYMANPSRRTWFMISDVNGKIISLKEATNGAQISFKYPNSVKDTHVYLSEITARMESSKQNCYVSTYLVPRINEFTFSRLAAKQTIGTSKITITNFTPYISDYFLSSGGTRSTSGGENNTWYLEMGHYKNPDDVFIYAIPSGQTVPRYKWITGVEINKDYTTDFTTFENMTLGAAVTVPTNDAFSYIVQGYTGATDASPITVNFGIYTDQRTTFRPYLPASGFSEYSTIVQHRVRNSTYETRRFGAIPTTFSKPLLDAVAVEKRMDNYSINTLGDFDYALVQFSNSDMSFVWTVFHPKQATITGKFPTLPSTVTKAFSIADIATLSLSEIRLTEADEISGYDDFIKKSVGAYYITTKGYVSMTRQEQ